MLRAGDEIELYFKDETLIGLSTRAARLLTANIDIGEQDGGSRLSAYDGAGPEGGTDTKKALSRYCNIVYENDNIIFANKRQGVLSQKTKPDDYSINEALLDYVSVNADYDGTFTPSICNRLDRNTSGLIIFAKTYAAAREINRILKDRSIRKYYLALCEGVIKESMDLKSWLIKNETTNTVKLFDKEVEGASYIETSYEPLGVLSLCGRELSLVRVELITGKTHQIRAHLASMGHPVAGDRKYGDPQLALKLKKETGYNGLFLHSWYMELPPRLQSPLTDLGGLAFKAAPPATFSKIIKENIR